MFELFSFVICSLYDYLLSLLVFKCEDSIYRLSMSLSLALTAESLLKLLDVKLFVVLTLRPEFI